MVYIPPTADDDGGENVPKGYMQLGFRNIVMNGGRNIVMESFVVDVMIGITYPLFA